MDFGSRWRGKSGMVDRSGLSGIEKSSDPGSWGNSDGAAGLRFRDGAIDGGGSVFTGLSGGLSLGFSGAGAGLGSVDCDEFGREDPGASIRTLSRLSLDGSVMPFHSRAGKDCPV